MSDVSGWVKRERKRLRIRQKDLAASLDVCQQSVSAWECGRAIPEAEKLKQLRIIFGTDPSVSEITTSTFEAVPTNEEPWELRNLRSRLEGEAALAVVSEAATKFRSDVLAPRIGRGDPLTAEEIRYHRDIAWTCYGLRIAGPD